MRELTGIYRFCVGLWAAAATLFQLYTTAIGFLEPREQRSLFLLFFLSLTLLLFPARPGRSPQHRPSLVDVGFVGVVMAACLYSYLNSYAINMRFEGVSPVSTVQLVLGSAITLLVIEGLRRAVTPVLAGMAVFIIFYLFTTEYWPGFFGFRNITFPQIVDIMYLHNGIGVFGQLTGIATTLVAIFIAFGAFMEGIGLGGLFNKAATRIAGGQTGGPAKVAVITSALFGTMSGSASANVFSTGVFTIPMMKRLGYRPVFAGGVEAAAGVGGQMMPPIMGAGAFVMAEITRTPYVIIIKSAALGAVCYFFMLLVATHLEARRLGLKGMARDDLPVWRDIVRDLHLLIPVVVLLVLLILHFSPYYSAFWSIISAVGVSYLRRHTRPSLKGLYHMLVQAGYNATIVSLACVGAGIIVAGLTFTGLSISIGSVISGLSGGYLALAGVLLMVTTIFLGMGLPTTAAYIVTASIGTPLLVGEFNVPLLAAHLFVFYFAILADATPPVSIASYAAASVAKSHPLTTGVQAFRLAIGGFIVGFSYLYAPAIRIEADFITVIEVFALMIMSLVIMAAGIYGFFRQSIVWPLRPMLCAGGVVLALTVAIPLHVRFAIAVATLFLLFMAPGLFSASSPVGRSAVLRNKSDDS
jgi:TRAP transporter 4TM/12TM fusion protein